MAGTIPGAAQRLDLAMPSHSSKVPRICQQCKSTFAVFPSEIRKGGGIFCSWACKYAAARVAVRRDTCLHCDTPLTGYQQKTYCSLACFNQHRQRTPEQDVAAFWQHVDRSDGDDACWLWMGACVPEGYGQAWFQGKIHKAHRVAYLLEFGVWPEPFGCHTCDNPPCCNPRHVFAGDSAANMADMRAKGRSRGGPSGESNVQAKLTANQVREIRARREAGETLHAIACDYGVSRPAIGAIVRRKTWRHVP